MAASGNPNGCPENLNPVQKGEIRNKWGAYGKPENREAIKKKRMEKKIIKEAVLKELGRVVEESGMTVLDILVRKTIQNAANGNDRLFSKLVDMIDGPIATKTNMEIESNQPLGVVILPEKEYKQEEE